MKKTGLLLFFAIILAGFVSSQSQSYYPIPSENAIWRESWGSSWGYWSDYQSFTSGDTVINNIVYTKLRVFGSSNWMPKNEAEKSMSYTLNYYAGAFRNDSANRKVYFIPWGENTDTLLYDFNLHLGSKLPATYIYWPFADTAYVSSIDSFYIGGVYHNRYWLSNSYQLDYAHLIEGIGGSAGITGNLEAPFEMSSWLECFILDNQTVYPDTSYICELATSAIIIQNDKSSFKIFPNPAKDIISIKTNGFFPNTDLVIYNASGTEVMYIAGISSETIIQRRQLKPGIYMSCLKSDGLIISMQKLILL